MAKIEPVDIGVAWLANEYSIHPVQVARFTSRTGKIETERWVDGYCRATFRKIYQPEDTFAGHFEFYLKRERISLEFCTRLFKTLGPVPIEEWIRKQSTGQYARRAGFLYEFLTGEQLNVPNISRSSYVNALDPQWYVCAPNPENNARWRIRNNLLGTPDFCPIIIRTDKTKEAEHLPLAAHLDSLDSEFGDELLRRSAVWLTIKESRASFAIEHESEMADRVRRFAAAMEREIGQKEDPIAIDHLEYLQREILGTNAVRYGLRRSPIFVGETNQGIEVVHYVAPHWDDLIGMLDGLREVDRRTQGLSSVVRSALLSFGFVYIHPLSDGNGRISRFLVNDVLRRDGIVPSPLVVPISAHIVKHMADYDRVLESISRPLMQRYRDDYSFGVRTTYDDGAQSNLEFSAYEDASSVWRYLDLTDHVGYLAEVLDNSIKTELRDEAIALRTIRHARAALNDVIEASDQDLDRIIRSIRENEGRISGKLESEYPILADPKTATAASSAVMSAFESED